MRRSRRPSGRSPNRSAAREIDHVVIAARGTSDHAAIYAQYVLGRPARALGRARARRRSSRSTAPRRGSTRSLVIGISQSGASPDVVAVIDAARRQGAPTLAITNDPASPLAERADRDDIDARRRPGAGDRRDQDVHDRLLAIAALSAPRMTGDPADAAAPWPRSPRRSRRTLGPRAGDRARWPRDQAAADRLLVLARGYEYATAREWALKIKELAHVFADPYSAADFQHGPLALVEPGVPVLAIVRAGPTAAGLIELLARLRDDHDAAARRSSRTCPQALASATWPVAVAPPGTPEWLGPIVVDRRRPAPRAAPDARARPRPGRAPQHPQGDADPLTGTLGRQRSAPGHRRTNRRPGAPERPNPVWRRTRT